MKHVISQKQIGKKIRELRKATGKPARHTAAKLGISRQMLYFIEAGTRALTVERLQLAARHFGVELHDIIGNGRKTA